MKKAIKIFPALVAMLAIAFAFSFASCSDDNDEPTEVIYTYGFSSMSSTSLEFLQEMNKIEGAYKSALGVTSSPFSKSGKIDNCDQEVKDACEKAYRTLSGDTWSGTYTYRVINVNTGKVVYEATFKPADKN